MTDARIYYPKILGIAHEQEFNELALELFRYQHHNNLIYRKFCDLLRVNAEAINRISQIPFLPIELFKTQPVVTGLFDPEAVFESSGTTGSVTSKHSVRSLKHYKNTFIKDFEHYYGDVTQYGILALLPSYLERKNSSLVVMADELIKLSGHEQSGFYLDDTDVLVQTLKDLEAKGQRTILLGVSFALLDLAEGQSLNLAHTTVMETGGMKGRKEEMIRSELHAILCKGFGVSEIHSEYGMTELLSQAYSHGHGIFNTPPWMKVLKRDMDDPMSSTPTGRGALNIIDLANVDSCCFIATQDVGTIHANGTFEVHGRMDHSDVRGCNLLYVEG